MSLFSISILPFNKFTQVFSSQKQDPKPSNLAVLHPRKLVIYTLIKSSATSMDQGLHSKLVTNVQHDFQRTALNFTKGKFGGVKKDYLVVMYLDGFLKFFEQDGNHECLLPFKSISPMIYVPRTDCFVLLTTNLNMECYRCDRKK